MRIPAALILVAMFTVPAFAEDECLQELTGVFSVVKWPYRLKIDGTNESIDLEGDVLKHIPSGTRVWVQGEIKTVLKEATPDDGRQASWPKHWRVFMQVKQVKIITKAFERPNESQNNSVEDIGANRANI